MNLWQYLVLLEGIGAVGTALGVAKEALRNDPLNLIGYANLGVALIALSAVIGVGANVQQHPNLATWIAAAGFFVYAIAVILSWLGPRPLERLRRIRDHAHHGHVSHT